MRTELKDVLTSRRIAFRADVKTATLSTFRIGGKAALVIEPSCTGELIEAVLLCEQYHLRYAVIGNGSNLLFEDGDIDTVLIRTTRLDAVQFLSDGRVRALCGERPSMADLNKVSEILRQRELELKDKYEKENNK